MKSNPSILSRFLVGHRWHPYLALEGANIRFKTAQAKALRALVEAYRGGFKSFLHVAPTSMGKGVNLAKAARYFLHEAKKKNPIVILTVDKVQLVNELYESVSAELSNKPVRVLNWNNYKNAAFSQEVLRPQEAIVLVITTQSLKAVLKTQERRRNHRYSRLEERLEAIAIDEAHHLGALETSGMLLPLVEKSSAFLYGATATPTHMHVPLREFFAKEHWSYLEAANGQAKDITIERTIDQLQKGIEKGEITPFDDIYIIGEPNFRGVERNPLFYQAVEGAKRVINPEHYQQLAEIVSPIIRDNPKGFIVTASIAEAARLADFLNKVFPDTVFEAYHSKLDGDTRSQIIENSFVQERHFIVAVRALDEGVNLPHLSAYIDLNASVSVKQMIHRIGRVLRLAPEKLSSDILFLTDFMDASMAKDLLALLDAIHKSHESGGRVRLRSEEEAILISGHPLSREALLKARDVLEENAKKFWATKDVNWMSFEEARSFIQSVGLKNQKEFSEWVKTSAKPANFPSKPHRVYQNSGWKGLGDFLGTGRPSEFNWLSYEEARAYMRGQGITSFSQYREWSKSGQRPQNIPSNPHQVYKDNGWIGIGDFLGTGKTITREWMNFEEAKALVRHVGISSETAFREWRKNRPENFPSHPNSAYRGKGWKGFGDFFGTDNVFKKDWVNLDEAKRLVREAGIKTQLQFNEWGSNRPDNIPANPNVVYKDLGWKGFGDFLGTGNVARREWKSFGEARAYVQGLGFKSTKEFSEWAKSGEKPADIPSNPDRVYKKDGWIGMGDFLGTGNVARRDWKNFDEARAYVQSLGFKNGKEFSDWARSSDKPANIPSTPDRVYKDEGWIGMGDFLGTGNVHSKKWMSFEEARQLMRENGITSEKAFREWRKNKPDNFPSHPNEVYKGKGWKGSRDFFGSD